jgi:hypothetical protein
MAVKKALLFTIDALIATIIIVSTMLIFSTLYIEEERSTHVSLLSNDMLEIFSEVKVTEIDNAYVDYLISQGEISNLNNSLIEQIGELWALNKTDLCENLIKNLTAGLLPNNLGFSFTLGDEEMYKRDTPQRIGLTASRKMISGYERSKPIKGTTSRAYLKSISEKKTYAYAYFGGFVGQGEIQTRMEYIPSDATIISSFLELDAASDFEILINNVHCDDLIADTTQNMTAETYNISSCNSLYTKGAYNNISISFSGDISDDFIAGGRLIVRYSTQELLDPYYNNTMRYYFPGIEGISNLYSSFYVPGTLHSMNVHLHFNSTYPTYLTIGDRTVFQNNGSVTGEETIDIDNSTLTSFPIQLDYADISRKTVPIRFASYNNTYETLLEGGNADVVLITDLSGSMKLRMNSWTLPGNAIPSCKESDITNPNSRRLGVAACLDSEFNAIVMNDSYTGNRLWLVDFATDANPFYSNDLSDLTREKIEEEIVSRYKSKSQNEIKGYTCLCCSINMAYDILDTYSNQNRTKTVLVMTDGVPTHCCGGYWEGFTYKCNETGTSTDGEWPLVIPWCSGDQDACDDEDCEGPMNSAVNAAKRLREDFNATVHAAGFGPIETCDNANETLSRIAEEGNGTFFLGSNASALREFYKDVAYNILESVNLTSQTLVVKGNVTFSALFPDSYVEMGFTPIVNEPEFGEISMTLENDKFQSCNDTTTLSSKIRILESKVTSYSGPHWTKNVTVNGNSIFLLEDYNTNFYRLGDPFLIYVPPDELLAGTNTISIITGDEPQNDTGCSLDNRLIYTAAVKTSTTYSSVLEKAEGCSWTIETEDSTLISADVPSDYSGSKQCNYTSSGIIYDTADSIDEAVYKLLAQLDFEDNGRININIAEEDLEIEALWVSQVPYLWGPAIAELRMWQ